MSLILAIEPNKNQAHQLNALVRQHLKAELVTAPTAAAALAALGERIPDVVLTPALFGLRDEAALTERLRQLGSEGSHVQTLAIPILAPAATRGGGNNNGLLGRKKDKSDPNVGCDPAVFADQIKIYLQRASVERRAQTGEAAARAMSASTRPGANAGAPAEDELSSFMVGADEFDINSLEIPLIDPPVAPEPVPQAQTMAAPAASAPDDAQNRRAKPKANGRQAPSPVEEELGLVTPPAAGPPLWRVTESIEDFYGNGEEFSTPVTNEGPQPDAAVAAGPSAATQAPAAHKVATANSVLKSAAPAAPRPRRTPPQPGEWGYFDPAQSSFKALTRRLDEIAGTA
jgi:CheY-like chemotaxis protein